MLIITSSLSSSQKRFFVEFITNFLAKLHFILYYFLLIGDLQCPEKCHHNAQCIELVFGGRKCVCNPGFEGDGIECAGELSFL